MKVIVAGSRNFNNYNFLKEKLDHIFNNVLKIKDITIISGHARGADQLGERYAKERKLKCEVYPADWDKHGKAAGYIRNEKMAKVGDILVAFWDGESRGTKHMIRTMKDLGKKVIIVFYKGGK